MINTRIFKIPFANVYPLYVQKVEKKGSLRLNPNVSQITGLISGYRVEEIGDPLMQKSRYLDKLVPNWLKGKRWRYYNGCLWRVLLYFEDL